MLLSLCSSGVTTNFSTLIVFYQQVSFYAYLVSGGKATVARMFVNNATGQRGLVCQYDVVCFDEISGITFDQKDGVNIMKGYMESGEFSRPAGAQRCHAGPDGGGPVASGGAPTLFLETKKPAVNVMEDPGSAIIQSCPSINFGTHWIRSIRPGRCSRPGTCATRSAAGTT